MKKICKGMICIIIIVMIICFFVPNNSLADGTTYDEGLGNLNQYKGTTMNSTKLKHMGGVILSAIQVIGTVLSVVILIVIGIKYMLGSVEEKADYKKTLVPYVVGAFILFTGTLIPQLIYKFMQNF